MQLQKSVIHLCEFGVVPIAGITISSQGGDSLIRNSVCNTLGAGVLKVINKPAGFLGYCTAD